MNKVPLCQTGWQKKNLKKWILFALWCCLLSQKFFCYQNASFKKWKIKILFSRRKLTKNMHLRHWIGREVDFNNWYAEPQNVSMRVCLCMSIKLMGSFSFYRHIWYRSFFCKKINDISSSRSRKIRYSSHRRCSRRPSEFKINDP